MDKEDWQASAPTNFLTLRADDHAPLADDHTTGATDS